MVSMLDKLSVRLRVALSGLGLRCRRTHAPTEGDWALIMPPGFVRSAKKPHGGVWVKVRRVWAVSSGHVARCACASWYLGLDRDREHGPCW
jgi:hypothetical protein